MTRMEALARLTEALQYNPTRSRVTVRRDDLRTALESACEDVGHPASLSLPDALYRAAAAVLGVTLAFAAGWTWHG